MHGDITPGDMRRRSGSNLEPSPSPPSLSSYWGPHPPTHSPGMGITLTPASMAALTMTCPGSEIPGIPASLTTAIDWSYE